MPEQRKDKREVHRNHRFIQSAASTLALKNAGPDLAKEVPARIGTVIGAGWGGWATWRRCTAPTSRRG